MRLGGISLAALLLIAVQVGHRKSSPPSSATFAKKASGARVTLTWDYSVINEPKICGFLLKSSSSPQGPYRAVVKVAANQRTVTFQVRYEPGKRSVYYVVVALEENTESAATNVVEFRKQ
jgi:hypothetical protein